MDVAIKGDRKNGYKIIEYLISLGGANPYNYRGDHEYSYYYINKYNNITSRDLDKGHRYKYLSKIPNTEKIYELWA
jgi:hypothetical protein